MNILQSKYTGYLVHITAWAVILGIPLFVTAPNRPLMQGPEYVRFLLVTLSFMVVFYTNYFRLIERHLFTRHPGRFLGCNLMLITAVIVLLHLFFRYILPPPDLAGMRMPEHPWQHAVRFFVGNAILYLFVVAVSVAIRMTGSWYKTETARQQLEHSRTEAELQNLKSQLNPHFLFNTLNNIYSLIQIDTSRAQQAVHDLSRMLRYVLYDSSHPAVPLSAEIDFLRDYIELMRIRLPRHVRLFVSLPDEPSQTPVAPLLFISLVENAFKHGVSYNHPSFIRLKIEYADGQVTSTLTNSRHAAQSSKHPAGIGLENVRKRLEMIYGAKNYSLEIREEEKTYTVKLVIPTLNA